jgi:hypothetical protein
MLDRRIYLTYGAYGSVTADGDVRFRRDSRRLWKSGGSPPTDHEAASSSQRSGGESGRAYP